MAKRQGFYLYHDDVQALSPLSLEQKGRLLDALMAFSVSGEKLETEDIVLNIVFNLMSAKITRDIEKYEAKCKRLQLNASGSRSHQKQANATNCQQMQVDGNRGKQLQADASQNRKNTADFQKAEATKCQQLQANATKCLQMPANAGKSGVTVTATVTPTVTVTETATVNNVRELYPQGIPPTPFIPPTLEDVDEFCEAQGIDVDPVRFVMYYTARGWKMGTTPMTDWKAAVRLWEQRDKAEAQKQAPAPIDDDEPVNWYEG